VIQSHEEKEEKRHDRSAVREKNSFFYKHGFYSFLRERGYRMGLSPKGN